MSKKIEPHVFEKGDMLYIVAPVSPFTPGETEIEEFAFAKNLKDQAPNENLLWLRGQYVEADQPNRNGQMWTSGELAIKSVTPNFMPVTVMHDPRTAVGLIADTELKVPDRDSVPRARIETKLVRTPGLDGGQGWVHVRRSYIRQRNVHGDRLDLRNPRRKGCTRHSTP
jgi:hypothetical protein